MSLDDETIAKLLAGSCDPLAKGFAVAAIYYPALQSGNPPQPDSKVIFRSGGREYQVISVGSPCEPD